MDVHELRTDSAAAPSTLEWGFLRIDALRDVVARVRMYVEQPDIVGVSIFGEGPDAAGNTSLVFIKMYRLPAAAGKFGEDLKFFGESTVPARQADLFVPAGIPAGWRHKAVQSPKGQTIIHAWRGGEWAMILRYLLNHGDVATYPLFRWAAEHVRIVEGAWRTEPPAIDWGVAATGEERGMNDRELDEREQAQIEANGQMAAANMRLVGRMMPEDVIDAIQRSVEQWRPTFAQQKPNVQHNMSVSVGTLWGQMLCRVTKWQWCMLMRDVADEGFLAIVSPDRAYAFSPVDHIISNLTREDPDNTVRLLFNMIRAGELPGSSPGAYRMLT